MPPKKKQIEFYSRGRNFRVIRSHKNRVVTATGSQMDTNPDALTYEFGPHGRLTVHEGQDLRPDGAWDPETGERTMQDAATFLRSRPGFNRDFFEEGAELDRPLPTEKDFSAEVTAATLQLDIPALEGLLEQERATHNREALVDQAESALEQVRSALEAATDPDSPLKQEPSAA